MNLKTQLNLNATSLYKSKNKLNELTKMDIEMYPSCSNSCMVYTGKYTKLTSCLYCSSPDKTTYPYYPLLPRLRLQFNHQSRVNELLYRYQYTSSLCFLPLLLSPVSLLSLSTFSFGIDILFQISWKLSC